MPFYNLHIKPFILCNELISLPSISPQTCKHLHRFIWLDPGLKYLSSYLLSSPNINLYSTRRRVPVNTRAIMDFNFGAAPLGVDPCEVHLNLKNTGSVPAEW